MSNTKSASVAPILVLFFNRPDHLEALLEKLVIEDVNDLYFAADGPRNQSDKVAIDLCWAMIGLAFPKLDCSRTLRRESNLGCRIAVSDALNWFYSKVESGIVIEDDCLPNSDFFKVLSGALVEYKGDNRIFSINATNPLPDNIKNRSTYLSIYPQIWGWASWAERWRLYRREFSDTDEIVKRLVSRNLNDVSSIKRFLFRSIWKHLLARAGGGQIDTWDYSMLAAMWRNDLYAVQLSGNYVINNGFDSKATHTLSRPKWSPTAYFKGEDNLTIKLKKSMEFDWWLSKHVYGCNVYQISKNVVKSILRRTNLLK